MPLRIAGANYLRRFDPSRLINFLRFLRDALDFCVFVLQADTKIEGRPGPGSGNSAEANQGKPAPPNAS